MSWNRYLVLVILLILVSSPCLYALSLEKVFIQELEGKSSKINSYILKYQIYSASLNPKKEGQMVWKKNKVYWEAKSKDGSSIIRCYDGKWEWSQGTYLPTPDIYRSNYKNLIDRFGMVAELVLPDDFRKPFKHIDLNSLKYIGIEKIPDINWAEYAYKFKGKEYILDTNEARVKKVAVNLFIDTRTGMLCKLEMLDKNGNIFKLLKVTSLEINPYVDESLFEIKGLKKIIDSTSYWEAIFKKAVSQFKGGDNNEKDKN